MAAKKKVVTQIKLQCPAGKATPAPPVGPALGPHGVSAPQFVQSMVNDAPPPAASRTRPPQTVLQTP